MAPHTHWVDGRIVDGTPTSQGEPPHEPPWLRLLAVLFVLVCVDLALGLAPAAVTRADPNPSTTAEIRATLRDAAAAAEDGHRSLVFVGDSVLAGDVLAHEVTDWRSQRVLDHVRAELNPDSDAVVEQVALDGLLPIDALHVLAELDRLDPSGEVELVLEINLRYFSRHYRRQRDCSREELCELGAMALAGESRIGVVPGGLAQAALGLGESATLTRDWLAERTPIRRRRAKLDGFELDAVPGLVVRRDPGEPGAADVPERSGEVEGLARVQEHYRSSNLKPNHAQVEALVTLLDRLAARKRRATLFLTPLEDDFVRTSFPGGRLGQRHEAIAALVNGHPASAELRVQLINLDHPLFEAHHFLDHVHLWPEGNRLLAINLIHELGLPLARRPFEWMMIHGEDHDRSLVHRRGNGSADGGAWEALLRGPNGVTVSDDGRWLVIADTGNHILRQMRGNMEFLERLAGEPRKAGHADGPALDGAQLESPISPRMLGERIYFIDGKGGQRIRVLDEGFVSTLALTGPRCKRYDELAVAEHGGREWLFALCRDDRILAIDLLRGRAHRISDPRAPILAAPDTGAAPGYTSLAASDDGRVFFADGGARIWELRLDEAGRSQAPRLVFANVGPVNLPSEFRATYPFEFDEVSFQQVVGMVWVERYGGLLVQDLHELGTGNDRLHRQETERIHLRFMDLESEQVLPWVKAIPHGDGQTMWNAKTQNLVSYYHQGSMAVAQDDAALFWSELKRSRIFRLADGLLGVEKYGNLHTTHGKIELFNALGTQTSNYVASRYRPDRFMSRRHEPIPRAGPYVALMVNSSMSTISDRIGNYSLGRRLELELQAELGYRDNIRLDLFQRTASSAAYSYEVGMFEEFLAGNGPPPDVLLFELNDFAHKYFRKTKTRAARIARLGELEALAARYDTLVIFYDNSAMDSDGRDGLRATHKAVRELIGEARDVGFVVLEPSDQLLRELLVESPWGNQPFARGLHHGSTWANDLAGRALGAMAYPHIRRHLLGRRPARLDERDPASFATAEEAAGQTLVGAFAAVEDRITWDALPAVSDAYVQQEYESRELRVFVDLAGVRADGEDIGRSEAELEAAAMAVLRVALVEGVYGGLATQVRVELVEFNNYDEYGEGVRESATQVWTKQLDRAGLDAFLTAYANDRGRP